MRPARFFFVGSGSQHQRLSSPVERNQLEHPRPDFSPSSIIALNTAHRFDHVSRLPLKRERDRCNINNARGKELFDFSTKLHRFFNSRSNVRRTKEEERKLLFGSRNKISFDNYEFNKNRPFEIFEIFLPFRRIELPSRKECEGISIRGDEWTTSERRKIERNLISPCTVNKTVIWKRLRIPLAREGTDEQERERERGKGLDPLARYYVNIVSRNQYEN